MLLRRLLKSSTPSHTCLEGYYCRVHDSMVLIFVLKHAHFVLEFVSQVWVHSSMAAFVFVFEHTYFVFEFVSQAKLCCCVLLSTYNDTWCKFLIYILKDNNRNHNLKKQKNCKARACNVTLGLGALYIIQAEYSHTETPKNEVGKDINKDYKQFRLQEAK